MKFRFNGQKGFSIIELMIVVGIIGVLASVGLPKFQVFLAKSKRAEVKIVLGAASTFEQAYYADTNTYGTDANTGYKATNNASVWTYSNPTLAAATTFSITMKSVDDMLCKGAKSETWTVTDTAATAPTDALAKASPVCT